MHYHPIIPPFSVLLLIIINDAFARGSGVWKFNDFLLLSTQFVKKLKTHIEIVKLNLQENISFSDHSKWELLKYGIRNSPFLSQKI